MSRPTGDSPSASTRVKRIERSEIDVLSQRCKDMKVHPVIKGYLVVAIVAALVWAIGFAIQEFSPVRQNYPEVSFKDGHTIKRIDGCQYVEIGRNWVHHGACDNH